MSTCSGERCTGHRRDPRSGHCDVLHDAMHIIAHHPTAVKRPPVNRRLSFGRRFCTRMPPRRRVFGRPAVWLVMAIVLSSLRSQTTLAAPVGPFLAFRRPLLDDVASPSAAAAASTIVEVERRAQMVSWTCTMSQ